MADKFTKSNFLRISQEVLDFQVGSLYPVHIQKGLLRTNLVFLNHDRNFSTFLTVKYLVEHERVADFYTISRSLFESVISMGLLAKAVIPNDLDRYQDYQFIETYRTHSHLERLGLEKLSGVKASEVERIRSRRKEYIRKYGRALSTWTGESLEKNVKLVDRNFSPTCNEEHFYEYLYCQIYRRGSPSAHASFAGVMKGVEIEEVTTPGLIIAHRFKPNEAQVIFSCFHSLLVFLSSVRFLGSALDKPETEEYFQRIARYVISEA